MAPRLFTCFRKASSRSNHIATTPEEHPRGPILVELFSSQGCSTSTEAEWLFSRLGRGDFNLEIPLVLLAYHVDYWDYNGWKDPFASSQWTVRQRAYVETLNLDTIFTPQIVVQGTDQCMGNEEEALLSCIMAARRTPAPLFQGLSGELEVSLTGSLRTKVDHEGVNIMVALFECGLITECQAELTASGSSLRLCGSPSRKALLCERYLCKENHLRGCHLFSLGGFQACEMWHCSLCGDTFSPDSGIAEVSVARNCVASSEFA